LALWIKAVVVVIFLFSLSLFALLYSLDRCLLHLVEGAGEAGLGLGRQRIEGLTPLAVEQQCHHVLLKHLDVDVLVNENLTSLFDFLLAVELQFLDYQLKQ
jgi:hypothetical protein